jgi:DNA-binding transcriptional ArsR family regulator
VARHSQTGLFAPIQERILALMLLHPRHEWYRSELARELEVAPSSLQRPLAGLMGAGIVASHPDGNRTYYAVDASHPALPELRGLLAKTSGVAGLLRKQLAGVAAKIRCAFVYGSLAAGTAVASSDVDLFVIGEVRLKDLVAPLRKAARQMGRGINPLVYTDTEFRERVRSRNNFIRGILSKPKLFVIGTSNDLEEATGR